MNRGAPSLHAGGTGRVTVVIPVWDNYVRFLREAVASVRDEAPDVPVVIVDNASKVPVSEHEGCTLLRAPHRLTVGAARNLGLDRVQTEFVIFLDADDGLLPGTIDFMRSRMDADPGLTVCVTSILEADTGERHRTPRSFVPALARRQRIFALLDSIWSLYPLQGCAIMRTTQVREAGGYADSDWGEDWVLAVSLAHRGRVEVSLRLGRLYRSTEGSLWRRPRRAAELAASARRVRERLRSDSAVPRGMRLLIPLIALAQLVLVYAIRPLYLALRGSRLVAGR